MGSADGTTLVSEQQASHVSGACQIKYSSHIHSQGAAADWKGRQGQVVELVGRHITVANTLSVSHVRSFDSRARTTYTVSSLCSELKMPAGRLDS